MPVGSTGGPEGSSSTDRYQLELRKTDIFFGTVGAALRNTTVDASPKIAYASTNPRPSPGGLSLS